MLTLRRVVGEIIAKSAIQGAARLGDTIQKFGHDPANHHRPTLRFCRAGDERNAGFLETELDPASLRTRHSGQHKKKAAPQGGL